MGRSSPLFAAALVAVAFAAGCSLNGGDDSANTAGATPDISGDNPRGAVEVALGDTAVVRDAAGQLLLEVSNSRLDPAGCKPNTAQPEHLTKTAFLATIAVGGETSVHWLWSSDFYYVNDSGKVVHNRSTSDSEPCSSSVRHQLIDVVRHQLIDVPPNSSADGATTLDIPASTTIVGYHSQLSGSDIRIEWRLPEPMPAATLAAPGVSVTSSTQAPASTPGPAADPTMPGNPVDQQPNPYPNSVDSYGRPSGSGDKKLVGCADWNLYQPGTGIYADGSMDYAPECLQGGSMAPR
ncbi:acyltransferase [Nocardia cyriacigeorgica]|uniref:acyltransferase n=1 Tax=Nocardia cyriacigeorgica TaxID=135487 RepID=UPI0024551676|nr:acyltransferase [Nocardia cyriacigeorgica]